MLSTSDLKTGKRYNVETKTKPCNFIYLALLTVGVFAWVEITYLVYVFSKLKGAARD